MNLNLYGIFTGLGIVLILVTADRILKGKIKAIDFLFIVLSMVFFSRLLSAILFHDMYNISIADWLTATEGRTLIVWGQLFGLGLAAFFVSKIRGIKHLRLTDALLLNYPIATSLVRLGNYFNQELYGTPTNAFWAIYIKPENRSFEYISHAYFHPIFAYEIILNILNWIFLLILRKKYRLSTGLITAFFMINYGIIRLIVNIFRPNEVFFLNIEVHNIFATALSTLGFITLIYFVFSKNTQKKFALIVSKLFNPFVVIIPLLIIIFQQNLFKVEPFQITMILLITILGLIFQTNLFKKLKLINNYNILITGIFFFFTFLLSLTSISLEIKVLTLSLTVATFLFAIISTQWKISGHLIYVALTISAIYLLTKSPLLILLLGLLLILISWSSVKLKYHNVGQAIAGTTLAIVVIVGMWFLTNSSLPF